MRYISLFQIIWTAGIIFVVSMVSQSMSDSKKTLKEKINIALVCSLFFTLLALGVIPIFGGGEY